MAAAGLVRLIACGAAAWAPTLHLPALRGAAESRVALRSVRMSDERFPPPPPPGYDEPRRDRRREPPPLTSRPFNPAQPLSSLQQVAVAFAGGFALALALQFSTSVDQKSLANVQALDRQIANPDVCLSYGAGAMVLDQRIFMSLNPLKVYVAPTAVKSGCVLNMANWRILEKEKLISMDDMKNCKMAFNTFAFTGDLKGSDEKPDVSCVYESSDNALVDKAVDNLKRGMPAGFKANGP
ncbi:hypothetical protein KFE25_005765 [Diacronema lutheri]|uniref:DUF3172 domain-containing protein n=2 Tax=Diacronema lutheri TaxID=2081491 RepID=A0A8J5X7K3_DIALT|nr:hypothetical protein KFE25_005765 [Diacronema lutheri]